MTKESKPKAAIFVKKLRSILEDPESKDSICWCQKEDAFFIANQHVFAQSVLPKYFKHKNLASFVRQLNIYEFSRVKGSAKMQYAHPCFLRANETIQVNVKRKDILKEESKKDGFTSLFQYEKLKEQQKHLKNSCRQLSQSSKQVRQSIENLLRELETMKYMKEKLLKQKQKQVGKELSHNSTSPDYNQQEIPLEKNYHGCFNFVKTKKHEFTREKCYQQLLMTGSEAKNNNISVIQQHNKEQSPFIKIQQI